MSKPTTRNIHININGKEVVNSFSGISKALRETNRDISNLNKNDADYNEQLAKHRARIEELRKKYGEYKDEIRGTSQVMKESSKSFDESSFSIGNFFNALKSGDMQSIHEELSGLSGGIGNVTKSALGFIATPIGAAITVLTGIVVATNYWLDYNNAMQQATKTVQQFTGLTGQALEEATARTRAFADLAEEELKTVTQSVNAVAKAYKIDYLEALKLVENGYVRGGEIAEDFFDNTSEYISQFKNAGYSASEFFSILEQGAKNGTYKDKIVDTIKEMDLRLKEFTKTTRDSLESAFGSGFTNTLEKGIRSGSIKTKEALQMINEEADRVGLNFQQKQQVVADVFGAMGEDAGGFNAVIDTINDGLSNTERELTDIEQAQLDVIKATEDLDVAMADLFAVTGGGFEKMKADLKVIVLEWLTKMVRGAKNIIIIAQGASLAWGEFKSTIKGVADSVFGLGEVWDRVLDLDFEGAKNALKKNFEDAGEIARKGRNDIARIMRNTGAQLLNGYNEGPGIDGFGSNDFWKDSESNSSTTTNKKDSGNSEKSEKERERELERIAKQKEREKEIWDKGETEIDELLKKSREARENSNLSGLAKEEAIINQKYARDLDKYKDHTERLKEIEAERDAEIAEARRLRTEEYDAQTKSIEEQNHLDQLMDDAEADAEKITKYEERALFMLEKAREIALIELDIEREKELAKVEAVEGAEELKSAIREKYARQADKISTDFTVKAKQLETDKVKWTELTEDQKLNLVKGSLNAGAEAFNEGSGAWKATKIAETTISTYQAATNSFNSLSGIPVVGPALGAAAAALAVVTGLKNIQKISNTPLQKMPTHYYGGYTGNQGNGLSDGYGNITGMVHENEWVSPAFMTQSPKYAPIINWLENEREMQLNGVTGSSQSPFFDNPVFQALAVGVKELSEILDGGIVAKTFYGYEDMEKHNRLNEELQKSKNNSKISS